MTEFPPLGNNCLVKDYPPKVKVRRKVIWHLCLSQSEKLFEIKPPLQDMPFLKFQASFRYLKGSVLVAGTA